MKKFEAHAQKAKIHMGDLTYDWGTDKDSFDFSKFGLKLSDDGEPAPED